jgi:ribosomal protein L32
LIFYSLRDKVKRMSIRMRHTRGHSGNRRSHHALKNITIVTDSDGLLRLPHRLNEATGQYRGKQIVTIKERSEKASKVKGPDTEALAETHDHSHEHAAHAHANAEVKPAAKGLLGKLSVGRPKARSGFGGTAS